MRAVNLLPADLRGAVKAPAPVTPAQEDSGGPGAFIALGALAFCVVALAGYIVTANSVSQHRADLEQAKARSAAVLAEVNRLKPFADFQQTANARIATVHDLASQRFDWERALGDLSHVLPSDVSVKSLTGSLSSGSGSGSSPLRGALSVPAITIDGCTADQTAVARMMSRLDTVSGVTRVSLAKSDKLHTETAALVAGSVGSAQPVGCDSTGKSDPPDFQVVVFFERAAALSVVAGAAPATPAAAPANAGQPTATASGAETPAATATPESGTPATTSEGAPE